MSPSRSPPDGGGWQTPKNEFFSRRTCSLSSNHVVLFLLSQSRNRKKNTQTDRQGHFSLNAMKSSKAIHSSNGSRLCGLKKTRSKPSLNHCHGLISPSRHRFIDGDDGKCRLNRAAGRRLPSVAGAEESLQRLRASRS